MIRHKQARELLGLVNGYTAQDIVDAFRAAVKAGHPDAGGYGLDMSLLTEARDVLLGTMKEEIACKLCKGRGSIKARFGSVECSSCQGEGTRA